MIDAVIVFLVISAIGTVFYAVEEWLNNREDSNN